MKTITPDYQVIVVGTGFSGLGMGIALKKAGINAFAILEKADDVGGTWRDPSRWGDGRFGRLVAAA